MKILFITEYFYPYIHGGAEISTQELAKALSSHGEEIHILTPNYGTIPFKFFWGIKIHRYFFSRKLKNFSDQLYPSWYFNPIFFLVLLFQIIKLVWKEKIQIIHVHSLFSLPAAVFAGKILRVPVIVTFRDAQLLCNYGFCLTKDQFGQSCNLRDYFFEDFPAYWQDKVQNKNMFSFVMQLMFAIMGRIRTRVLQFFANMTDIKVVSSFAQQKTFAANGLKTRVIYNIFNFSQKFPTSKPTGKIVLYATKMSSGKGLDVLLEAFGQVLVEIPDVRLLAIGSGDKKHYEEVSRSLHIDKNVEFRSRKSPEEIMETRQKALLEVAPSLYPESFGRTALESLASGVPAVVSNRGGLADIVVDGKMGYVTSPTAQKLAEAMIKGIKNNQVLRRNIRREYAALKQKFSEKPLEDHLRLYKSFLK